MKYKLSNAAKADIKEVFHYTADKWSKKQARLYTQKLRDTCAKLAEFPRLGRPVLHVGGAVYVRQVEKHSVFYVEKENGILILAILHEKMDVIAHLVGRL